jgi:hypothetical protein
VLRLVAVRLHAEVRAADAKEMAWRMEDLMCLPHPLGKLEVR